jgi:hypothetical protein
MSVCPSVRMEQLARSGPVTFLSMKFWNIFFPEDVSSAITLYTSVKRQNELREIFWDLPQAIV